MIFYGSESGSDFTDNFGSKSGSGSDFGKVSGPDPDPTSHFFPMLQNYSLSSVVYECIFFGSRSGSDLEKVSDPNPDPNPLMLKVSDPTGTGS
jgi:hypothetical protein